MKRKEAIKRTREGVIQVFNDYHPSTKEIKKFSKEAFPDDKYVIEENCTNFYDKKYFYVSGLNSRRFHSSNARKDLPIINLSTITKRKKTKLKQLEKQFSDLAKDVAEIKERFVNDVEVVEEEIDWNIPQMVISDKGKIVATNGNNLEYSFEGMVVVSDISLQPVNHFYNKWGKLYFKPFKGELTIK